MKIDAFTSDPHYWHANVIKYANRPFGSVEEMNEAMIAGYNAVVGPRDTCLWLGDCFLCRLDTAEEIMRRLNGVKLLVRGNHDRPAGAMARIGFALVQDSATLHLAGRIVRAHHRPWRGLPSLEEDPCRDTEEPHAQVNEFLMHGHTHSPFRVHGRQIHVGVDAWGFRPALREEVETLILAAQ